MNKKIVVAIIAAVVLVGAVSAYMIHQRNQNLESSQTEEGKKMDGDAMTEQAVDNAMNGKQPMDGQSLPVDEKPKANNLQGEGAMQGGVIMEGKADLQ